MSADPRVELRTAATLLRQFAADAVEYNPAPWTVEHGCDAWATVNDGEGDAVASVLQSSGHVFTAEAAHWIAAMGPDKAEPLADWLEYEADNLDEWFNVDALQRGLTVRSNPGRDAALQFARTVLASQQQETQPPTSEEL